MNESNEASYLYENNLEKQGKFKDFVIYNSTLYKDDSVSKVRAPLALKFFKNAENLGIRCVVSDGGSNREFLDELQKFSNVTILPKGEAGMTMGEERRNALEKAMELNDAAYFMYSDPEKDDLIREENLLPAIEKLRDHGADMIVLKRSDMSTLNDFQRKVEERANKRASKLMTEEGNDQNEVYDLWFGPKLMTRDSARYFLEYGKGKLDKWDSIIVPAVNAARDGRKVASLEVDYKYDPTQTASEEDDKEMHRKRLIQYVKILQAFGDSYWTADKIKELEEKYKYKDK